MSDLREFSTSNVPKADIGQVTDELATLFKNKRRNSERRWYDNNFFYDGFHFRYFSRSQNKIVDLSERTQSQAPLRAIPKASLQVDGLTNLLISRDFVPVIYPKKIDKKDFQDENQYKEAMEMAKMIAKKNGYFVTEEFKNQDMDIQIPEMVNLGAKHFVSFMQIWPHYSEEKIMTKVYDAFDILLLGELTELEDEPLIIKITPQAISKIKANKNFDSEQVAKLNPDNKFASSDIKEAYMKARYGGESNADATATVLLKECFIKEYLSNENRGRIQLQDNAGDILKDRKDGDVVMRHVFTAGNIWLRDEYLTMKTYPFVDFRFKPGPLYQVPPIERFIPTNKSLDIAVSRIERFFNTMTAGAWLKRQGEQFNITNEAGGQIIEYKTTPPVQAEIKGPGGFAFNVLGFFSSLIEEQGLSTSTLGKLPKGVKAHAAIESLKESEYSSLVVPTKMLKKTVQRIATKMMEIADEYFVTPSTVYHTEKGEPSYFDIIGKSALERRKGLKIETANEIVPIDSSMKVEIDVQTGLAYTKEGQKAAAKELGDYLIQLQQLGLVDQNVVKVYLQQLLNVYQFGATADIMEAVENSMASGGLNEAQIMEIKTAVLEVMKDLVDSGVLPDSETRIEETKVGVAEVMKDAGSMEGTTAEMKQKMQIEKEKHMQDMVQKEDKAKLDEAKILTDIELKKKKEAEDLEMKKEESQLGMAIKKRLADAQAKAIVTNANKPKEATK